MIQSYTTLYRQLSHKINQLPFDCYTKTLLHSYKRHKYCITKPKQNDLYYVKLLNYYVSMMDKAISIQDDSSVQELLNIAYHKSIPLKERVPQWYLDFINLSKSDIDYIIRNDIWPVRHVINEINNDTLQMNYMNYLSKQKQVRNNEKTILSLFPNITSSEDLEISNLINQVITPIPTPDTTLTTHYSTLIAQLKSFISQIRSHHDYGNLTIQDLTILQPSTPFGTPIPQRRSLNLVRNKIKYFKSLMYTRFEPILKSDLHHLENIIDDENLCVKYRKRVRNFLKLNYCINNDELIFSKYRILKTNYFEIDI